MAEFDVPAGHAILAPMSLKVAPGDHICLLGPSGIGKTTLLNRLAGLERGQPRPTLRIGYLFQEHRLLPWRTLRDNLRLVGVGRDQVKPLLARVGLEQAADRYPDQLSLGMARRAALARCLAMRPDLLLLDEPFASLDPHRADELKGLIRMLLKQFPAMAMICVTHEARDAEALANRIWYLAGAPPTCATMPGSMPRPTPGWPGAWMRWGARRPARRTESPSRSTLSTVRRSSPQA
ncbi:ABC transporter ATP-binding protein [Billgrantia desiderata]|uniref:ABC transporter ATP-binding protein n=1 Tax=Billgrantia desiderata TaxID=52021 RepID=UPI000A361CE3|nr:ATP-binding cassette domain-containing protein [Halomonas desiderata]